MRLSFATVALWALAPLLSVDCGGATETTPPSDCPADVRASCTAGAACIQRFTDCDGPHALTCSCSEGRWQCPQLGAPACAIPTCPPADQLRAGAACSGAVTCQGTLACPDGRSVAQNYDCVRGAWQPWTSVADPCLPLDAGVLDSSSPPSDAAKD